MALTHRFPRILALCSFLIMGLLVASCDSSGSNGSTSWTGRWEVTEASGLDLSQNDVFYDITSETIIGVLQNDQLGCRSETLEIVEVDGNVVTVAEEDGETDSGRLEVQDSGNLLIEDIGSTNTATAEPAGSVPSCN